MIWFSREGVRFAFCNGISCEILWSSVFQPYSHSTPWLSQVYIGPEAFSWFFVSLCLTFANLCQLLSSPVPRHHASPEDRRLTICVLCFCLMLHPQKEKKLYGILGQAVCLGVSTIRGVRKWVRPNMKVEEAKKIKDEILVGLFCVQMGFSAVQDRRICLRVILLVSQRVVWSMVFSPVLICHC